MQSLLSDLLRDYGLVTVVLLCLVVPFFTSLGGMFMWFLITMSPAEKSKRGYYKPLTQLALRNGWRTDNSNVAPSIFGRLPNYTEWKLTLVTSQPLTMRWMASIATNDDKFLVVQRRGTQNLSTYGRMRRYIPKRELHPEHLTARFYFRTNDKDLADSLLTPEIAYILRSWHLRPFPLSPNRLKIHLSKNQLAIDITPTRDEQAILDVVTLGESLVDAYLSPA